MSFTTTYQDDRDHAPGLKSAAEAVRPLVADHEYDVAFSFAGEDREIARTLADVARANGLRVFMDEFHVWETWGRDLTEYLGSIYGGAARYCVMLISHDYCKKPYTIAERRFALAQALESKEEYVLPIVLDDSWPPGLPKTTAYLDLRTMALDEVGHALVSKLKEPSWRYLPATTSRAPALEPVEQAPVASKAAPGNDAAGIEFAHVTIAAECEGWEDSEPKAIWWPHTGLDLPRWAFRGGFGYYGDPILDVTLVNRSHTSRLITRIGLEATGTSFRRYELLGGGGGAPVLLHRTYEVALPDLWRVLADGLRQTGQSLETRHQRPWPQDWVRTSSRASCRLPDPILVDPGQAYRFGFHLVDYTELCPTEVEMAFWADTDAGEARSGRAWLGYVIGSEIPPMRRFLRMLRGEPEVERQSVEALNFMTRESAATRTIRTERVAYQLWEDAGRPQGRDGEFWATAELEIGRQSMAERDLWGVHKRGF